MSNLYDFPARRQSSTQGRWISPDPAGRGAVILTNPQTSNLYAYVISNPLSFVDPTGMNQDNTCAGHPGDCADADGDPCANNPNCVIAYGGPPDGVALIPVELWGLLFPNGAVGNMAANNQPTWNNQGKNLNCKAAAANTRNVAIDSHNLSLSDIFKVPNFIEAGIAGGLGSISPILKGAGWGAVATGFGEAAALGLGAAAIYNDAEWGVKNNAPFEAQQNAIYNNAAQQCIHPEQIDTHKRVGRIRHRRQVIAALRVVLQVVACIACGVREYWLREHLVRLTSDDSDSVRNGLF